MADNIVMHLKRRGRGRHMAARGSVLLSIFWALLAMGSASCADEAEVAMSTAPDDPWYFLDWRPLPPLIREPVTLASHLKDSRVR